MTAEWAMSELLRRSGSMAAATDELSRVVGRTRWATERDLLDPPLHRRRREQDGAAAPAPVAPLLVRHQAREEQGPVVPAQ